MDNSMGSSDIPMEEKLPGMQPSIARSYTSSSSLQSIKTLRSNNKKRFLLLFMSTVVVMAVSIPIVTVAVQTSNMDLQVKNIDAKVRFLRDHVYEISYSQMQKYKALFSDVITNEPPHPLHISADRFREMFGYTDIHSGGSFWLPRLTTAGLQEAEMIVSLAYNQPCNIHRNDANRTRIPVDPTANFYVPVMYAYPETFGNALCFDTSSEATRNATIVAAVETGEPAATPPIILQQDGQISVLIMTAVYEGGGIPSSIEERWDKFIGVFDIFLYISSFVSSLSLELTGSVLTIEVGDKVVVVGDQVTPSGTKICRNFTVAKSPWNACWTRDFGIVSFYPTYMILLIELILFVVASIVLVALYVKRRHELKEDDQNAWIAEEGSRVRSVFMSQMTHELRTPLSSITLATDMLDSDEIPVQSKEMISIIKSASKSLIDLVNDVLDLNALQMNGMAIESVLVGANTLMMDVVTMMTPQAHQKNLYLEFETEFLAADTLLVDPKRVRQILINLIGNAVKFTHRGGVSLRAGTRVVNQVPWTFMEVTDTGIGIADENMEAIFTPFSQVGGNDLNLFDMMKQDASTANHRSTGLGLSISKELAEKMGGHISLVSEMEHGSTFTLFLPMIRQADVKDIPDFVRLVSASTAKREVHKNRTVRFIQQTPANILLVDDNLTHLKLTCAILMQIVPKGTNITICQTGAEAIKYCNTTLYNLIFMDLYMPGVDGLTTTRKITAAGTLNQHSPVVALSAAVDDLKRVAMESGLFDYLSKPVSRMDLIKCVESYIPY